MGFNSAHALAAGNARAHCQILKARDSLILDADELLLHDQVLLLLGLLLSGSDSLTQLLELLQHQRQVLLRQGAERELLDERALVAVTNHQPCHVLVDFLAQGRAWDVKVDAEVGGSVGLGHCDVLDGGDVEGHGLAVDGHQQALALEVDAHLRRVDVAGILKRAVVYLQLVHLLLLRLLGLLFAARFHLADGRVDLLLHQLGLLDCALGGS